MGRLKGIPVLLTNRRQTGTNELGVPVYEDVLETVENVLVTPTVNGGSEVLDSTNLEGKKAVYRLAIPKGDAHEWEGCKITFFGQDFESIGATTQGIEALIPLEWNKQVLVKRYGV